MTVSIINQFMQNNSVPKKMLQLIGITARLIAEKIRMHPSETGDFNFVTDNTCTKLQIRQVGMKIL